MNKAELKKIERLKRQYLIEKCTADEIFQRSQAEYEALSVCEKRKGDQAYNKNGDERCLKHIKSA